MNTYYCHACMKALNLCAQPPNPETVNLTGSAYQFGKFVEHTIPASGAHKPINSIYSDPDYDTYKGYYVSGSASGSLEILPNGKKNIIWYAHQNLGPASTAGGFAFSGDAVKIVFPEDAGKLHHFHVDSSKYQTAVCKRCGGIVLT
jgi:hypothetical protein